MQQTKGDLIAEYRGLLERHHSEDTKEISSKYDSLIKDIQEVSNPIELVQLPKRGITLQSELMEYTLQQKNKFFKECFQENFEEMNAITSLPSDIKDVLQYVSKNDPSMTMLSINCKTK
jgi:hypothetical protein